MKNFSPDPYAEAPICDNCQVPYHECDCEEKEEGKRKKEEAESPEQSRGVQIPELFGNLPIGSVFRWDSRKYRKVSTDIARNMDATLLDVWYQQFPFGLEVNAE